MTATEQQRLLLGVAALHHVVRHGRSAVVVAPRREDAEVWADALREHLPETSLATGRVLVTTARAHARGEVREGPTVELLLAVDAERFGTPGLAAALDARCGWRLGISGGYRRSDGGLARLTDPYFSGGVVHAR